MNAMGLIRYWRKRQEADADSDTGSPDDGEARA
jgi:hypothetical protein